MTLTNKRKLQWISAEQPPNKSNRKQQGRQSWFVREGKHYFLLVYFTEEECNLSSFWARLLSDCEQILNSSCGLFRLAWIICVRGDMWCLFHENQSLGKYVSIFTLTGPEKKRDSAGNGSVKRVSIRGKKQSLFGISGLVNVWAVKLHGVIKNYESGVIKAVGLSAKGARSPTEIVRGSIPHSIRTLNDFPVPALVFLQLLLFHLTIQTH